MANLRSALHAVTSPGVLVGLGVFSIVATLATVVLVPLALARLPADYFARPARASRGNPAVLVLKNVLGVLVILPS